MSAVSARLRYTARVLDQTADTLWRQSEELLERATDMRADARELCERADALDDAHDVFVLSGEFVELVEESELIS